MRDEETFEFRDGAIDFGKDYEYLMASYYALTFSLNDEVIDFKISTNNDDLGDFDDVVIEFELTNGEQHVFAIQLKHVSRPIALITLTTQSKKSSKKFGLKKYIEDFQNIKKIYHKGRSYSAPFENFRFVLFSNSTLEKFEEIDELGLRLDTKVGEEKVESDITIKKFDDKLGNSLINLTNEGFVYVFQTEKGGSPDEEFFKQFYFYTKQKNVKEVESLIADVILNKFENCGQDVVIRYLSYFSYWCRQDFGTLKITKQDVRLKLAELLLSPYIPEPNFKEMAQFPLETRAVISNFVLSFDALVMEDPSDAATNHLWSIFLNEFKDHAKNWSTPLAGVYSNIIQNVAEMPMSALNEHFHEMSLKKVYLMLWHLDMVPLIVNSSGRNVSHAISLCQNKGGMKKLVVLDDNDLGLIDSSEIAIFRDLSDLVVFNYNLFLLITQILFVSFQRRAVSLRQFLSCDERLLKTITLKEILLIADNSLSIGDSFAKNFPKYYVTRHIPKILLNLKVVEEVHKDIFVISCIDHKLNLNAIDVNKYLLAKQASATRDYIPKQHLLSEMVANANIFSDRFVIVTQGECSKQQFEEICLLNNQKNCHLLRSAGEGKMEWVDSFGSIEQLRPYQQNLDFGCFVKDADVVSYFDRKLNLICAEAGMGKTVLLQVLKTKCPLDHWVCSVNLNDHIKFFRNTHTTEETVQYFTNTQKTSRFTKKVIEIFVSQKKIIFFWDGFDEVSADSIDTITATIKSLASSNYKQWIFARSSFQNRLESAFNTFALTLTGFSDQDKHEYVSCHLKEKYEDREDLAAAVDNVNKTISASLSGRYFDYSSIPLHIHMVMEIFLKKPLQNLQIISLTDIYHEFIQGKFDSLFQRAEADPDNYLMQQIQEQFKNSQLTLYETLALKASLDERIFSSLKLDCDDFLEELSNSDDSLGLILNINEDKKPVFTHKTYEEFLAASWLAKNCHNYPKVVKELYKEKHTNIRLMFDMLLAKGSSVHLAVLYRNLELLEKSQDDISTCKDSGGRSALQVASSWGRSHPAIKTIKPIRAPLVRNSKQLKKGFEYMMKYIGTTNPAFATLFEALLGTEAFQELDKLTTGLFGLNVDGRNSDNNPTKILVHPETDVIVYEEDEIYLKIIKFLLAHQCNPLEKDALFDWNAFDYADYTLSLAAVDVMLGQEPVGVNSLINCNNILTVVHYAVPFSYNHLLELVVDVPFIEYKYGQGVVTFLQLATEANNLTAVSKLLNNKHYQDVVNLQSAFLGHPLNSAIYHGNTEMVTLLLEKGAIINGLKACPLGTAVFAEKKDCCELLIRAGADVNQLFFDGTSPLMLAVTSNQPEIARLLLENGANIDHVQHDLTPVASAASRNNLGMLLLLLKYKPNLNYKNSGLGYTPLHYASQCDNVEVLKLLLDHGADPKIKSNKLLTPLHVALLGKKVENALELIRRDCSVVDEYSVDHDYGGVKLAPLTYAVLENLPDVIEPLVEAGADVHTSESGTTPLHLASKNGFDDCVRALIKKGASANRCNREGKSSLLSAVDNISTLRILLDNSADVNFRNKIGSTALHRAAGRDKADAVEELINRGAAINAKDYLNKTPLFDSIAGKHLAATKLLLEKNASVEDGGRLLCEAVKSNDPECIALLLKHGIEVNAKDVTGNTPLCCAVLESNDCVQVLLENGADVNASCTIGIISGASMLLVPVLHGKSDILQQLLEAGAEVNSGIESISVLHISSFVGDICSLILLINFGADVNGVDSTGCTPLHYVCQEKQQTLQTFSSLVPQMCINYNSEDCAAELITKNANVDQRDHKGNTPLHLACKAKLGNLIKLLVVRGADVNALNNDKLSPLLICYGQGDTENVDFLRANGAADNLGLVEDLDADSRLEFYELCKLLDPERDINSADDSFTLLHTACYHGVTEMVDYALTRGANIESKTEDGATPLFYACNGNHKGIVKMLLQKSCEVNVQTNDGNIPLHFAVTKDHHEIVSILCEAGSNINWQNSKGMAPLHLSAKLGFYDSSKVLVEKGAEVHRFDNQGLTPLDFAIYKQRCDLVRLFVSHGAKISQDLLTRAATAESENTELLDYLLKNGADPNDSNALHISCERSNFEYVECLLRNGADVHRTALNGRTPLMSTSSPRIAALLLSRGANIEQRDDDGWTVLLYASFNGSLDMVEFLVESGCDVNHRDEDGNTALYRACLNNNHEVVSYLLENGADVSAATEAIHVATGKGNLDIVKLLVAHQADIADRDRDGITTLRVAAVNNQLEVLKYFAQQDLSGFSESELAREWYLCFVSAAVENHVGIMKFLDEQELSSIDSPDPSQFLIAPLHRVCLQGCYDAAVYLIENGADLNAKTSEGFLPIHFATIKGHCDLVKLLAEAKADVDVPNNHGNTPLFSAASGGCLELVEFLHKNGARIHVVDEDGDAPLHDAAAHGHLMVVKYLVENGADLGYENKNGKIPFDLAVENSMVDVVEYLVKVQNTDLD